MHSLAPGPRFLSHSSVMALQAVMHGAPLVGLDPDLDQFMAGLWNKFTGLA